ncbi:DUF4160 domain-containing protein [Paraburkholderia aspalathi]|uniref:DUF4160 domain-containing protein n=1 Tax=Paraburkholderia aspalathi TaxID=1324617 RepID=UPI0038BACB57
MPTFFRALGYSVLIYTHDHRPAHVYAVGPNGRCVFDLNCPDGPLELREASGIATAQIRRLARAIEPEIQALCAQWRKFHGRY